IEALPDPCPTPFLDQAIAKATGKSGRRRLGEKQKLIYAPMSDVGGVLVDKDAVYVDIKSQTFDPEDDEQERGLGEQMVVGLQGGRKLLGQTEGGLQLFGDGEKLTGEDLGRKSARVLSRRIDDDEASPEDEGFESGDDEDEEFQSGDSDVDEDADEDMLVPAPKRREASPDATGEEIAFADSDSDLGSMSEAEDVSDPE
ncbi:DUF663-domain-containing protein, partial [Aureobasidium melanogenum]